MRSKYDEERRLRLAIGDLVRAAAPPGWSDATVRCGQVGGFTRVVVDCDGVEVGVQGLEEQVRRLRELAYRDGEGTWFSCELRFTPGSRSYRGHVDADGFPFPGGTDIPGLALLEEPTVFPRRTVPGWLLDALPTVVPMGIREPEDLRRHFGGSDRSPDPEPIVSGELAYTPIEHMVVRGSGFGEEREGPTAFLHEKAGGGGDHLLFFGRRDGREQPYWVARGSMRGTGGGITACVLDERRLVLHLTPRAADDMETETVLTVDLNLTPAETEQLRTALSGVFHGGSSDRMPALTGF
ncbi:hypothetical protein AB0G15_06465 [Streptosporangium sp. NPDC023825]|uniref:hypothetical protein n=1 Tax=Streptosporangium sp. NPDC023825 TaxID=3154909 RepID=UPI0034401C39